MSFIDPAQGDKLLGAFRVVAGIKDVPVIIHSPVGCHWGVNYIETLSSISPDAAISVIKERDVIFGGKDNLRKILDIVLKKRKSSHNIIVLIGSVPSLIGDDYQGILNDYKKECRIITIECAGFLGKMAVGYEEALASLFEWVENPNGTKATRSVNLIGLEPDVIHYRANLTEVKRIFGLIGVKINSSVPCRDLTEIKRMANADLNVVLGYGTLLAKKMEESFGIPYIKANYPIGITGTQNFLQQISSHLELNRQSLKKIVEKETENIKRICKSYEAFLPALYGAPAAVSADSYRALALSKWLTEEIGMDVKAINITSISRFNDNLEDIKKYSKTVLLEESWHRFEQILREEKVAIVFGGDMEIDICKKLNIPLVHFSFPNTRRAGLSDTPNLGFKGMLSLVESLVNKVLFDDV